MMEITTAVVTGTVVIAAAILEIRGSVRIAKSVNVWIQANPNQTAKATKSVDPLLSRKMADVMMITTTVAVTGMEVTAVALPVINVSYYTARNASVWILHSRKARAPENATANAEAKNGRRMADATI